MFFRLHYYLTTSEKLRFASPKFSPSVGYLDTTFLSKISFKESNGR